MAPFAEPLAAFMGEFSTPAVWYAASAWMLSVGAVVLIDGKVAGPGNTGSAPVILDQPDEEVLSRRAQSRAYLATYQHSLLPLIKHGDFIVIGAVVYNVQRPRSIDDGVFFEMLLEAA